MRRRFDNKTISNLLICAVKLLLSYALNIVFKRVRLNNDTISCHTMRNILYSFGVTKSIVPWLENKIML